MAWRLANSLVTLKDQINSAYPNRSKVSDGTIGDSAHASSASDHNPNVNGVVCAMDITHSPETGLDAHALADRLIVNRHPNLRYIVSNSRIAGTWTNWQWTPYSGSNPHTHHIHISVGEPYAYDGQSKTNYDNTTAWDLSVKGDEAMSIKSEEFIRNMYRYVGGREPSPAEVAIHLTGTPESLMNGFIANNDLEVVRLRATIQNLQSALANEQAKPPKEVVKEIEKKEIVTEYVDRPVIQEVTKPFTDEDGKNWLINLFKRIFKR